MNRHADDAGVFIRSLATRGALGGISRSTGDVVNIMDAMGMDIVIIETVGVGQDEIDIVQMAHTTAVVMVPGLGDDIQAIKAGILEIADVFVVNKADRDGAERTARELSVMLEMGSRRQGEWLPRVMKTEASRGIGIDDLVAEIEHHRDYLHSSGAFDIFAAEKNTAVFAGMLRDRLFSQVYSVLAANGTLERIVAGMANKEIDPYSAVEGILAASLLIPEASP